MKIDRYYNHAITSAKLAGMTSPKPDCTPKTKDCPKCPREMIRHNAEYRCGCGWTECIPEKP